jgi:hypothetical protein
LNNWTKESNGIQDTMNRGNNWTIKLNQKFLQNFIPFAEQLSAGEIDGIQKGIFSSFIPFFGFLGEWYPTLIHTLHIIHAAKYVLGCIFRAVMLLEERGLGWWLAAALWDTAFIALRVPRAMFYKAMQDLYESSKKKRTRSGLPTFPQL